MALRFSIVAIQVQAHKGMQMSGMVPHVDY